MKHETSHLAFSKDRPILLLTLLSGALIALNTISVVLRLRPSDFKIPIQYIVHDGTVVQSGNWYSLYSLALFAVVCGVMSILLAHRLHKANRIFALVTLIVYVFVAFFSFLAINSLLSLVGKV